MRLKIYKISSVSCKKLARYLQIPQGFVSYANANQKQAADDNKPQAIYIRISKNKHPYDVNC